MIVDTDLNIRDVNRHVHNDPRDHFLTVGRGQRAVVRVVRLRVGAKQAPVGIWQISGCVR